MRRGGLVPVLLLVAVGLAACGGSSDDAAGAGTASATATATTGSVDPLQATVDHVVLGLCAVRAQAETDPAGAATTFDDEVHEALHELAAEIQPVDPAAAADVLEAKERVESDFAEGAPAGQLGEDLATLLEATTAGVGGKGLGLPPPSCPA